MPNMQIQPFTGMQNPQQPLGGLLTAGFNPYPQASLDATASPGGGLLASMGPWSQLAYQMAGSPKQGGAYAQVTPPPTPVNTNATGSSGGSALGSIATGLLGSVLKNPQLLKGAYNGISGLLGGGAADGSAASILAGGSPTLSTVGTGAVAPAVDSAAADAGAALAGTDAGAGAATGGLLGSGAIGSTGASSLAASGGFATGGAAGAGSSASAGGSLLGAAAPLAVAGLVGLIGSGAISDKANDAGNDAMAAWAKSTGAKWVPSALGTTNGMSLTGNTPTGAIATGHYLLPDGSTLTKAQAAAAITAWGKANNVNTGNIHAGP